MKPLFAGLQSKKEISISKKEEICSTLNSLIFHNFLLGVPREKKTAMIEKTSRTKHSDYCYLHHIATTY